MRGTCRQKSMRRSNRNGHNISSIKKLEVYGNARTIALDKRKGIFIEDDMPGDDDSVGREIKAAVSFVMSGVAKEDTHDGPLCWKINISGKTTFLHLLCYI